MLYLVPAEVIDLVVAMDGSESLKKNGFGKVQELAKNVVNLFKISKRATHVGLLEFSSDVSRKLPLDKLYEVGKIKKVIENVKASGGYGTLTDKMLKAAADNLFAANAGGRADAAKILVVVTDGKSSGKTPLKEVAKPLKEEGIRVYVVDIGDETDPQELRDITPSDKNVIKAKNPKETPKMAGKLASDVLKANKKSE